MTEPPTPDEQKTAFATHAEAEASRAYWAQEAAELRIENRRLQQRLEAAWQQIDRLGGSNLVAGVGLADELRRLRLAVAAVRAYAADDYSPPGEDDALGEGWGVGRG